MRSRARSPSEGVSVTSALRVHEKRQRQLPPVGVKNGRHEARTRDLRVAKTPGSSTQITDAPGLSVQSLRNLKNMKSRVFVPVCHGGACTLGTIRDRTR